MASWDRIQRMDLDLKQANRRVDLLVDMVEVYRLELVKVTAERDHARAVAVRLEQEVAACEADIHTLYTALAGAEE